MTTSEQKTTYITAALEGELAKLRTTSEGRNNTLFKVAARCYQFSEAGAVSEAELDDCLTREARTIGLPLQEIQHTLKSARKSARGKPARIPTGNETVTLRRGRQPIVAPEDTEPPNALWQRRLGDFIRYAQGHLGTSVVYKANKTPLVWLKTRGLQEETIHTACLGYNPEHVYLPREQAGLLPEMDERGKMITKIWLPAGIVIPWYVAGELWRVTIRQPTEGSHKYHTVNAGGKGNALYNADAIALNKPAMLVEGVFDVLAVQQVAGDLIAPVACGTTGARRIKWIFQLSRANVVLVSLDNDQAGQQNATTYWLTALSDTARRWRPLWSDPSAMVQQGFDVRAWVQAGLELILEPIAGQQEWLRPYEASDIRTLWAAERASGHLNPTDELMLDLDQLGLAGQQELADRIARRMAERQVGEKNEDQ